MSMLDLLTKSLRVAYTGFTASVVSSARYSVVEVQAPATRDIFVTSVIIHSGVSAFLEKGSSSFVTSSPAVKAPDARSNFSTKLTALGSGCYGSSSTAPNLNGLLIPSSNGTIPGTYSVEVFPVPMIVEAGEFLAMISESNNAAVRYGFRWLEVVAE